MSRTKRKITYTYINTYILTYCIYFWMFFFSSDKTSNLKKIKTKLSCLLHFPFHIDSNISFLVSPTIHSSLCPEYNRMFLNVYAYMRVCMYACAFVFKGVIWKGSFILIFIFIFIFVRKLLYFCQRFFVRIYNDFSKMF